MSSCLKIAEKLETFLKIGYSKLTAENFSIYLKMKNSINNSRVKDVSVVVDRDKNLKYETHNWAAQIFRIPILLILNLLPKRLARAIFLAFSGHRGDNRTVSRSVATYKALEVMYTFPARRTKGETNATDFFWEYFLSNARAFRNRIALVKREILTAIKEVEQRKKEVNLLSLGSGSARGVFEVLYALKGTPPVKAKLIDASKEAIFYSQELAHTFNINQIEWHQDYAQNLEKYCQNFQPDIVEMVGLLDYYPQEQAVDVVTKIYNILSPGGRLITGNVCPNFEKSFVDKGIGWQAIYRTPHELAEIMIDAGFSIEGINIVYEPFKIHALAICQKLV